MLQLAHLHVLTSGCFCWARAAGGSGTAQAPVRLGTALALARSCKRACWHWLCRLAACLRAPVCKRGSAVPQGCSFRARSKLCQPRAAQEKTADAADDGVFALMNHTAYALAALTGPPPQPPQNTSLVKFRPPMVVLNSTDLLTQTQAVAINLTERLINATEHALDPSEGGLYGQLAGMLRGDGKDAAPRPSRAPGAASGSPGAAALQSGAGAVYHNAKTDEHDHSDKSLLKDMQKLVGNDTINALEAAVFPFILVRPSPPRTSRRPGRHGEAPPRMTRRAASSPRQIPCRLPFSALHW